MRLSVARLLRSWCRGVARHAVCGLCAVSHNTTACHRYLRTENSLARHILRSCTLVALRRTHTMTSIRSRTKSHGTAHLSAAQPGDTSAFPSMSHTSYDSDMVAFGNAQQSPSTLPGCSCTGRHLRNLRAFQSVMPLLHSNLNSLPS